MKSLKLNCFWMKSLTSSSQLHNFKCQHDWVWKKVMNVKLKNWLLLPFLSSSLQSKHWTGLFPFFRAIQALQARPAIFGRPAGVQRAPSCLLWSSLVSMCHAFCLIKMLAAKFPKTPYLFPSFPQIKYQYVLLVDSTFYYILCSIFWFIWL